MDISRGIERWLGVTRPPLMPLPIDLSMGTEKPNEMANAIWRVHAALDAVYGAGFAKDNPAIVAQFMLAVELAALREVIAGGTGGITVGIERI